MTSASSWPWVDHSRLGSTACNWSPISDSLSLRLRVSRHLTLLQTSNSPDHYAKGTPSADSSTEVNGQPPTACRRMVSGSATPHLGFFSPFPHGTGSLSVTREYLALESGLPGFSLDFTCPAILGIPARAISLSSTGLSPSVVSLPRTLRLE